MERVEILKKTNDDWHPNLNKDECKLMYIGKLHQGLYRVAVWGNDDFGIDKDFQSEKEAIKVFDQLKQKQKINHQDLYSLGFSNF